MLRKIKYLQILEDSTLKSPHAYSVPTMIFGRESRGRTCCKLQMQVCGIVHRNGWASMQCNVQSLKYYPKMADSSLWKARMQTAYWQWYFSQWKLTIDNHTKSEGSSCRFGECRLYSIVFVSHPTLRTTLFVVSSLTVFNPSNRIYNYTHLICERAR